VYFSCVACSINIVSSSVDFSERTLDVARVRPYINIHPSRGLEPMLVRFEGGRIEMFEVFWGCNLDPLTLATAAGIFWKTSSGIG